MQDLSDVLARLIDKIEENDFSADSFADAGLAAPDELKSLLHVVDRIRSARNSDEISAEVRERSRRAFYSQLK